MICPVCRWQNFIGEDICENCGADLSNADTPQATTTFQGELLGRHLDELGAPRPKMVERTTSVGEVIARMQSESLDCVLVTDDGNLVGIFTDRDAVLKVAGGRSDLRHRGAVIAILGEELRGAAQDLAPFAVMFC